ncbi:ankyrin repeat domain-containing protein 7-like [Columba livia]|uniref:ankyrin repeat domain-containing protein 7-like n=1 Tax=Columba livia TaxID=8932 RepID=UPI0031BA3926
MRHSALLCQPAPCSDPSVELRRPSCKQRRLAPPEAPGCQGAVSFAVLGGRAGLAGGSDQCLGTGVRLCRTPLHLACANGHADVVHFLAGKKCKLNPRGMYKKTPLMLAVQHQHKDCVTALLEHGADADRKGAGGNTALHMAALMPSKAMVELLLEHNAQIDARNDLGYTPLAVAIIERREEMVEFLLEKGADVNARDIHQR